MSRDIYFGTIPAIAMGSLQSFHIRSVGATIFYALGLATLMIGAHASFRVPDDATLFADEIPGENGSLTGLLSMFKPRNGLAGYAASAV